MFKEICIKIKRILFFCPNFLYEQEHDLLNKPFYFSGKSSKAILLIHGWTAVPYELKRLGMFLNEKGYTVYAPLLSGHGTSPVNLKDMKWEVWKKDSEKAYEKLKENHEKIFVIGTSIGANLGVILSECKDICGLVLMAMPYRFRLEKIVFLSMKFFGLFFSYGKKIYPPSFGDMENATRKLAYQRYPLRSVLEVLRLVKFCRKILPEIKKPCLLMQSTSDHLVEKNNLECLYEKIGSQKKEKKYIKEAYHTFISDIKNEHVFEDIAKFIEEN